MFSHGLDGHPEKFTKLFTAWADAGFAVAAPAFPLTNSHAADPNSNIPRCRTQHPAMSPSCSDNLLAMNKQPESRLFHAIDEHKIGAGGLSLGGLTTYMLAYDVCCRDQRVHVVAVLDWDRPDVSLDGHVRRLIAHSDRPGTSVFLGVGNFPRQAHRPGS